MNSKETETKTNYSRKHKIIDSVLACYLQHILSIIKMELSRIIDGKFLFYKIKLFQTDGNWHENEREKEKREREKKCPKTDFNVQSLQCKQNDQRAQLFRSYIENFQAQDNMRQDQSQIIQNNYMVGKTTAQYTGLMYIWFVFVSVFLSVFIKFFFFLVSLVIYTITI